MQLPARFTEEETMSAAGSWTARVEQASGKLKGERDERSVETLTGIRILLERNWFRDRLNEAMIENQKLIERIHQLSEAS